MMQHSQVLQEQDDFCGVRVMPIGKLFEKKCGWPPGWQWTM
jgi:hypothetical protein